MSGSSGVFVIPGSSGETYVTTSGSNLIDATGAGNDLIYSGGADTINAGSGIDTVYPSGPMLSVNGGTGGMFVVLSSYCVDQSTSPNSTVYGGSGGGEMSGGTNSLLVAGSGNYNIGGGAGSTIFGGSGADSLESPGQSLLVSGTGRELAYAGNGDTVFGGANASDTFLLYNMSTQAIDPLPVTIVEGNGFNNVQVRGDTSYVFCGTGSTVFQDYTGFQSNVNIVGFTSADSFVFEGLNAASVAGALAHEQVGAFGSSLSVGSSTVTFFGATVTGAQVS